MTINEMEQLPIEFAEYTKNLFGEQRYERFIAGLMSEPVVSVRCNPTKYVAEVSDDFVSWAGNAYYLDNRPLFTADPLFHAGCYYVQEASSMFLEQVIRQYVNNPVRMLDLCAAPGGKSTHALSLLPEGSLFVANEPVPLRAAVLAENIIKWGNPSAVVTRNEPADFAPLKSFFDIILVDAPCSGEGMFRKDERALTMWSSANVKKCVTRQRAILAEIWDSLRPGGLLIYSTCTFNQYEDEEMVAWVRNELDAEVLPVDILQEWGITGNLVNEEFPVYRFIPGITRGEGFFLALLRKKGDESAASLRSARLRMNILPKTYDSLKSWLFSSSDFSYIIEDDKAIALPLQHQTAMIVLKSILKVLHCGVPLAVIKNKKVFPLHQLAMSCVFDKTAFSVIELSLEHSIMYLRGESFSLQTAPLGTVLFTYKNVPLGFAKNVGNRVNNLYPAEWRIRKEFVNFG